MLVEVILHNSKLLCALFYRPPVTPSTHDSIILSELESTIEALPPSKLKNFILLGDFNIDCSNYQHPLFPSLLHLEDKFGLVQVVTSDTRCSLHSSTLIDHVYLSEGVAKQHYQCDTLPPVNSSDHRTLSITIHLKPPLQAKHQPRKLWLYKKADFDSAKHSLKCIPTCSLPDDPQSLWTMCVNLFLATMKDFIPCKHVRAKSNKIPYLSHEQTHLIRIRNRLFRLVISPLEQIFHNQMHCTELGYSVE